jgi:hypothetical protein
VQASVPKRKALPNISEGTLLSYGVPEEWLSEVLNANEDDLLEIAGHLPAEAGEALLNLATGIRPPVPEPVAPGTKPAWTINWNTLLRAFGSRMNGVADDRPTFGCKSGSVSTLAILHKSRIEDG